MMFLKVYWDKGGKTFFLFKIDKFNNIQATKQTSRKLREKIHSINL